MGLAPFCAGLIAPALGLRAYFGLTIALTVAGLALWLRSNPGRRAERISEVEISHRDHPEHRA